MMKSHVEVGLPPKKRQFDLMTADNVYGSCLLQGSVLYLVYNIFREGSNISDIEIKEVDLNSFDGNEDEAATVFRKNNMNVSDLRVGGDYFVSVDGELNNVIHKDKWAEVFSDEEEKDSQNWKFSAGIFTVGGHYYRQIDRDKPQLGIDVVEIESKKVVGNLKVDFVFPLYVGDGLIAGERVDGSFGLFSIANNSFVYELSVEKYFNRSPGSKIYFSRFKEKLALACSDSVVIFDLHTYELIQHVNCLQDKMTQSIIDEYDSKESHFKIRGLSFSDDFVFIYGDTFCPYLMCINVNNNEKPVQWVYTAWYEIAAEYSGGDLIFGIEKKRPVAWDIFSGEKVWEGSAGTIANRIEIGDGWVVYSQFSGYIQCFGWKKPYISPHRPAA